MHRGASDQAREAVAAVRLLRLRPASSLRMRARERLVRQFPERLLVTAGSEYLSLRHDPEWVDDGVGDTELPDAFAKACDEVGVGRPRTQAPGASPGKRDVNADEAVLGNVERHVRPVACGHRQARGEEQQRP